MRFAVLGSGSGGNAAVIDCNNVRILVDAGLSARQLQRRLLQVGIPPESINAILLTHEHGDHINGLRTFLKSFPIPVYTSLATSHVVSETVPNAQWKTFDPGQSFAIEHLHIDTFSIQHDAVDPVGFVLHSHNTSLGMLSDAGHVTRSMTTKLRNLHSLFVEANYDDHLLANDTKRPWSIKQRISSQHGHLSNKQVAALIAEIAHPLLHQIVLGHLSSDCNSPDVAIETLRLCLQSHGHPHTRLSCATQHEPTPWFNV